MNLVGVVALALATIGTAAGQEPIAGPTLLLEACVQCHNLKAVTDQRKDEASWRRTVNEMIWRGAPLMPGEADVLSRYLARSFAATAPPARSGGVDDARRTKPAAQARVSAPDLHERNLPPGPGRALVLRACVSCHGLATTINLRKTREQWSRSVDVMVRLGARLQAGEIETVADYLTGFLGAGAPAAREDRP